LSIYTIATAPFASVDATFLGLPYSWGSLAYIRKDVTRLNHWWPHFCRSSWG